jgi:rare lipoprotein A
MKAGAAAARSDAILDQRRPDFDKSIRLLAAFALGAFFASMLAGCSSNSYYRSPIESYGPTRTEVASWYGPGFEGRRTSSGESFNSEALTAASPTLPLGSHVRVMNPDTGRSVVVRINDRGPFVHGRALDLSHGAAERIGLTAKGAARVEVTPAAASTPGASSSRAAYAGSDYAKPRNLSYVSYLTRFTSARTTRRHYRYRSSRRIVSDPIGAWISSAFPRL